MSQYLNSERRELIAGRLAAEGRVVASDLAREFETSEDTIRRDLRALAAAGQCRRVYGGALSVAADPAPDPGSPTARAGIGAGPKRALGAALARLIEPGMVVFLDAGSTNLACARAMPDLGATLITHAPAIAAVLAEGSGNVLVTLGGRVDPKLGAAVGGRALSDLDGLRPDLALIGACGLDAGAGVTAHSVEDAAFKRVVALRSRRVAVAAGREKIGTAAAFRALGLGECDVLVLEAGIPAEALASLRSAADGARIVEVECGQ